MKLKLIRPKPNTEHEDVVEVLVHQDDDQIFITARSPGKLPWQLLRLSLNGLHRAHNINSGLGFALDDVGRLRLCT